MPAGMRAESRVEGLLGRVTVCREAVGVGMPSEA